MIHEIEENETEGLSGKNGNDMKMKFYSAVLPYTILVAYINICNI